jgi:hypothetical protein
MYRLIATSLIVAASTITAEGHTEPLHADNFMSVMKDNTLSGVTQSGVNYNVYFLPGGAVTLKDSAGRTETGTWSVGSDDEICIKWKPPTSFHDDCYKVDVSDSKVAWQGRTGSGHGGLLGEVSPMVVHKAP